MMPAPASGPAISGPAISPDRDPCRNPRLSGPQPRGWCPGVRRPMATGDGLLVRIRVPTATVSATALESVAELSSRYGNGLIDLTARAAVQVRGVRSDTLEPLTSALEARGLAPPLDPVASLVTVPLAGLDPQGAADVRPLAERLALILDDAAQRRELIGLPAKTAITVDDGGGWPLDGIPAAFRLRAITDDAVAVGLGGAGGTLWLGAASPACAADAVLALAAWHAGRCRDGRADGGRGPCSEPDARATISAITDRLQRNPPHPVPRPSADDPARCAVGIVPVRDGSVAVGLGLAFGRIEAERLIGLADLARRFGDANLRLSPWRALFVTGVKEADIPVLKRVAAGLGLITDANDPRRRIAVCTGTPGCASATISTRGLADRIASALPWGPGPMLHVSGCAKGCAHPDTAPTTIVGQAGGTLGIVRDGRAGDAPHRVITVEAMLDEVTHG